MTREHITFRLRYVGARFQGARLPLDMLPDLPAFRDLLVSYAKEKWRSRHPDRKRLPKGFDESISFDLVSIETGSAMPNLVWSRSIAQATLPGFADELEDLVGQSYEALVGLVDGAGHEHFPDSLSSERIRALNRFGSGLRDGERIEFPGSEGVDHKVVYLDTSRRKALITHVKDTYETRFDGIGRLLGSHIGSASDADGYIRVETREYGKLVIPMDPDRVIRDFDGNINADVQFALQIELDNKDLFRNVVGVFDVEVIDAEIADALNRCRLRLDELRSVAAGWHDGGGSAIDAEAAGAAEAFLSKRSSLAAACRIYPTHNGGISLEFEKNGWDYSVEFGTNGTVEMYGVEINGGGEMEPQVFRNVSDAFLKVLDGKVGI